MALKATIYKAVVNVADLDRNQFLDASLTLARHPSETQERMMLRLLAWIKYADERLQFTRGLSLACRMNAGSKRPAPSLLKLRCLPITSERRRSGGNKIKINVRSSKILPSGIWMMNSWRS